MSDFDDLVEYRVEVRRIGQQLDDVAKRQEEFQLAGLGVMRAEFDAFRSLLLDTFGGLRDRVRELERLVPTLFAVTEPIKAAAEEQTGGVFNSDDWRERLRQRGLGRVLSAERIAARGGPMTADEISSFKTLGSLFNPAIAEDGPCFNRDDNVTTEGR